MKIALLKPSNPKPPKPCVKVFDILLINFGKREINNNCVVILQVVQPIRALKYRHGNSYSFDISF